MNMATIYEVTARKVGVMDSFTVSRSNFDEPTHVLGNGLTLVGLRQMPARSVQAVVDFDGKTAYVLLPPVLRASLEAPIRAEFDLELELSRVRLLSAMYCEPWYMRMWRALVCRPLELASQARTTKPPLGRFFMGA